MDWNEKRCFLCESFAMNAEQENCSKILEIHFDLRCIALVFVYAVHFSFAKKILWSWKFWLLCHASCLMPHASCRTSASFIHFTFWTLLPSPSSIWCHCRLDLLSNQKRLRLHSYTYIHIRIMNVDDRKKASLLIFPIKYCFTLLFSLSFQTLCHVCLKFS